MMEIDDIVKIRKKLGLTQAELAQKAGVSQSLVTKIESGKLEPTYNKAKRIFDVLDTLSQGSSRKARDIMNRKVVSAGPMDGIRVVILKMKRHSISQIPVLEGRTPVGLVTEGLLLERMAEGDIGDARADDIMGECPPIVSEQTDISAVSSLLRYFPLVLVSARGRITGLITKSDIIEGQIK